MFLCSLLMRLLVSLSVTCCDYPSLCFLLRLGFVLHRCTLVGSGCALSCVFAPHMILNILSNLILIICDNVVAWSHGLCLEEKNNIGSFWRTTPESSNEKSRGPWKACTCEPWDSWMFHAPPQSKSTRLHEHPVKPPGTSSDHLGVSKSHAGTLMSLECPRENQETSTGARSLCTSGI